MAAHPPGDTPGKTPRASGTDDFPMRWLAFQSSASKSSAATWERAQVSLSLDALPSTTRELRPAHQKR